MINGNFERLPKTISNDAGRVVTEIYETILIAMELVEVRRAWGSAYPQDFNGYGPISDSLTDKRR